MLRCKHTNRGEKAEEIVEAVVLAVLCNIRGKGDFVFVKMCKWGKVTKMVEDYSDILIFCVSVLMTTQLVKWRISTCHIFAEK